jgi:hypothetical protein
MNIAAEISRLEKRLRDADVTINRFLAEADVNYSQWWRWQHGPHKPMRTTWARIMIAADKLAPRTTK